MIPFELADAAQADIQETLAFYRAPSRLGDEFSGDLRGAIMHLREWPFTGHRRRDLTKADVCFWTFGFYYLVVRVSDGMLSIVAVIHTSRNVARILKNRLK
jgi:plasmid stabilization system protein ParE